MKEWTGYREEKSRKKQENESKDRITRGKGRRKRHTGKNEIERNNGNYQAHKKGESKEKHEKEGKDRIKRGKVSNKR